ncbi:type IV toxin-antitoxin system AbiEi family antitoxin domain-containing protein [soil metagenome]
MRTSISATKRAIEVIRDNGGSIRTQKAIASGIYPRTLANLVEEGKMEKLSRGLYRIAKQHTSADQDLLTVATLVPSGVICLISALAFHKMTTQIPREVNIALPRSARTPRVDYPPVSIHRFSSKALTKGIEKHIIDGTTINIYNVEKTLADCFKFRNRIGMDVVLEALKLYKSRKKFNINSVIHFARICRVEKQITPYLESIA